jgi:hypothetical protein
MYIILVVCGCHNKQACCDVELMYIILVVCGCHNKQACCDVDDVHHPGGFCLLLHCHRESELLPITIYRYPLPPSCHRESDSSF